MPELPEVETIVRQIRPGVLGQRIVGFSLRAGGESLVKPYSEEDLKRLLFDKTIISLSRIGKFIRFQLSDNSAIISHLRMTGRLYLAERIDDHKHNRLGLFLEDAVLNFLDTRRFATFHYLPSKSLYKGLLNLGPDALSDEFNADYLVKALAKRTKSIYASLMDQSIVAGLGNIYANETLYAARIHPLQPSRGIDETKAKKIVSHAKRILNEALKFRGTTLIDRTYLDAEGEGGNFFNKLNIYGKNTTLDRNNTVEKTKIGGRTVYFAPKKQVLED